MDEIIHQSILNFTRSNSCADALSKRLSCFENMDYAKVKLDIDNVASESGLTVQVLEYGAVGDMSYKNDRLRVWLNRKKKIHGIGIG
jgi:hypothetical protein